MYRGGPESGRKFSNFRQAPVPKSTFPVALRSRTAVPCGPPDLQISLGWSQESPQNLNKMSRTLRGHSRDTFGHSGAPEAPLWDTPSHTPILWDTLGDTAGTNRARKARKTPVAGRGVRNCSHAKSPETKHQGQAQSGTRMQNCGIFWQQDFKSSN